MAKTLKTVLLLALPASGKSEVRRYLDGLAREECEHDFHMGLTVQLDDFLYVHIMRCIDDELEKLGRPRQFFVSADQSFIDRRDWGTLIQLINDDHADLVARREIPLDGTVAYVLDRIDAAGARVGLPARLAGLDAETRSALAGVLEPETRALVEAKNANLPKTLEGRTLVIEFARGGPDGADMPLPAPHGYRYSLAQLSPEILADASILYIWVTPEESRRKNTARADPDDPGSILHHGVPMSVMLGEYGCDDIDWLEAGARKPGTVPVDAGGRGFDIPLARFDNRQDKTSFIREDKASWAPGDIAAIHQGLKGALDRLIAHWS